MIEKVLTRRKLNDPDAIKADLAYWLSKTPDERVSAVEILRKQRHGDAIRMQRVVRVCTRAELDREEAAAEQASEPATDTPSPPEGSSP